MIYLWIKATGKLEERLKDFFYELGKLCGARPLLVLSVTLLVTIICSSGLLFLRVESKGDRLWVPQDSAAMQHREYVEANYELEPLKSSLIYTASGGGNVLTVSNVQRMFSMNERILALQQGGKTFSDLCFRRNDGECEISGILRFWRTNYTLFNETVTSQSDLLRDVSALSYPDGDQVIRSNAFGRMTVDTNGNITAAEGVRIVYMLNGVEGSSHRSSTEGKWETKFLAEAEKGVSGINVYRESTRSIDDELERSVSGDTFLYALCYVCMIIFSSIALGGKSGSRSALASCGVLLVFLSTASGYGIGSYLGVPFSTLHKALPFILVGIGIDDMFVITAAFDRTNHRESIPIRCAVALSRAGLSITTTSLTDAIAFSLGTFSAIPALQHFCVYAAFSILVDFGFQVTAFVAMLSLDTRRKLSGRADCLPCILRDSVREKALSYTEKDKSPLQKFMLNKYGPLLLQNRSKIVVILSFCALLAVGIHGASQTDVDFRVIDMTPDKSYLRDFLDEEYALFGKTTSMPIGVYTFNYDYADKMTQQRLVALEEGMLANKWVTSDEIVSWFRAFRSYYTDTAPYSAQVDADGFLTNSTLFFQGLRAFLNDTQYSQFQDDVVLSSAGDQIERARFFVFGVDTDTGMDRVDAMESVEASAASTLLTPTPFAFAFEYVHTAQLQIIRKELLFNLFMALTGVGVVMLVLLRHPGAAALLLVIVFLIDIELWGFVYYWGLTLNSATVLDLAMAIGLVVDYLAHLAHVFMLYPPEKGRNERMTLALGEIGPSVLLGGVTTLIGVMPLAIAQSYLLRTFFKMFFSIVLVGVAHGMILAPVLLSLVGPSIVDKSATWKQRDEVQIKAVTA